jgi:hypothetical protein
METVLQRVRPATCEPDNKLSEDIVKFNVDLLPRHRPLL